MVPERNALATGRCCSGRGVHALHEGVNCTIGLLRMLFGISGVDLHSTLATASLYPSTCASNSSI